MAVPGVKVVKSIEMTAGPDFKTGSAWSLALDPARAPKFDLDGSTLALEHNGAPLSVWVDRTQLAVAMQTRRHAPHPLAPSLAALQPPPGRDRHVGRYFSVQEQLPAAYGVGALGLPATASPQRQAQAQQLKAYLMFFDQLLANSFAQLAHLPDLFGVDGPLDASYFFQPVQDPGLGVNDLYLKQGDGWQDRLQGLAEAPEAVDVHAVRQAALARLNRFLNHLLASVGEQIVDHTLVGRARTWTTSEKTVAAAGLARSKQRFLQEYPRLSRTRGGAFNYLAAADQENCAGLVLRLRGKLGLNETDERFYLVEHLMLRPMPGDAGQTVPVLVNPRWPDPYSLQLSFVLAQTSPWLRDEHFQRFVERTIREETPAHLIPTVCWLGADEMGGFKTAYDDWREKRRSYWLAHVHDPLTPTIALRDARDRLIDLLGIGESYPLQDLAVADPGLMMVGYGRSASITVEQSQLGVDYALYEVVYQNGSVVQAAAPGRQWPPAGRLGHGRYDCADELPNQGECDLLHPCAEKNPPRSCCLSASDRRRRGRYSSFLGGADCRSAVP